ncbi:L-serine ammonia-lyase [Actinomadura sp. 7K507]|uniref:L-serine ammonia-lyase n=1 Tax=Actinomadura sp. 7K507 TaxID=2530365 RepID=UPI00104A25BA|nr:L-serine ammonia-lyase [Actinomadura sp. 7K507]TDC88526.1 L-serine ammonia-lyase [Actinomadura sp. 7K507]
MTLSAFDLFSIGIGPSSSHTVGPMRASRMFVGELRASTGLAGVRRLSVRLLGSLGATGPGHGTPGAVLAGLEGRRPESVDPALVAAKAAGTGGVLLGGETPLSADAVIIDLCPGERHPRHPNALEYTAYGADGEARLACTYYSVGGGFVERDGEVGRPVLPVPLGFRTASELLAHCRGHDIPISEVMWRNECARRAPREVRDGLLAIWAAMSRSIERGFHTSGVLPGGLRTRRRAPVLFERLSSRGAEAAHSTEWLAAAAMAVNEENAAGGRVVTAPTNGAAGIVPAVLYWALRHLEPADHDDAVVRFLLCAAAIAVLFKEGASVSGAEVGCQGEVGSACAMAAGAVAETFAGTPAQVENAAEIGIEHNLGLTCDPIAGLVQIPCIERNAVAAVKAVTAARIALHGDGTHRVFLDDAIATMRQTGLDMHSKYKETSTGGLAVNVPDC